MKLFTNTTLFILISLVTTYAQSQPHIPPCQGIHHQNGGNCYGYATARAFGREWNSSPCSAATLEQSHDGSPGIDETYFYKYDIEDWEIEKEDIHEGDILYFNAGHVAYVSTVACGGDVIVCDHKTGPYATESKGVNVDDLINPDPFPEYGDPTRYYRKKNQWKIQVQNSFGSGQIHLSPNSYLNSGEIQGGLTWEHPITMTALYDGEVFNGAIRDFIQWNKAGSFETFDIEYTYIVNHRDITPMQFTAMYHNWLHFTFQNSFTGLSDKGNMKVNGTTHTNISIQDTFWVEKDGSILFEALYHSINNINYYFDHWSDQSTSASRTINDVSTNGQYTAYFTGKPSQVTDFMFDCGYNEPVYFTWDQYPNSNVKYRIYRKMRNQYGTFIGPTLLATLNNNQTSYTDQDITKTRTYEYLVSYDVRAYYTVEQTEAIPSWSAVFGNWLMKDGSNSEEENSSQLPKEFSISNYPNPFNPETTIEYTVPESSPVNIRIFNSNGQLVSTLINKYHSPGVYRVKWSGSNSSGQLSASGIYFMVMELPGKVINRKLLLVR